LLSVLGIVLFTFGKERSVKVNLTLMILSLLIAVMGLKYKKEICKKIKNIERE